jgi:hypothetical protein
MHVTDKAHTIVLCNFFLNETSRNTIAKDTIPKMISKIFMSGDGELPDFFSDSNLQKSALLSWKMKNPGQDMKHFGTKDCRAHLKEHSHPVFSRSF